MRPARPPVLVRGDVRARANTWRYGQREFVYRQFHFAAHRAWCHEIAELCAGQRLHRREDPDRQPGQGPFVPAAADRATVYCHGEATLPWLVFLRFLAVVAASGDVVGTGRRRLTCRPALAEIESGPRPHDRDPELPGPPRHEPAHRLADLRTDRTWTGCPRRAVVYWPLTLPVHRYRGRFAPPRRPPPAGPGRATMTLIVARPANEGTKRTTAASPW